MFKIGEFSKLTQVTVRMLRYYDEMGLLKPARTDAMTGYRMYSAQQIPVLNKIIYLRDSGFNVAEIAEALKKEDSGTVISLLDNKYAEIIENIESEKEKLKRIELARKELSGGDSGMHYQVQIKSVPAFQVLSLRRMLPDYYAEGLLWEELSAFVRQEQIAVSNQSFSIYHDAEYKEKDVDVELCVLVEKSGKDRQGFSYRLTEPVPVMASTMVYGSFSNIGKVYRDFAGWLQGNSQYQMGDTSRQIVHRGPWNEESPSQYLTEIQIPLKKREISA